MPSPPPFSSETAAGSVAFAPNGTSRPDRNGETLTVLPNGVQNTQAETATTPADRLRAQKEIAKAQLSSTEIPPETQPVSESLVAVNGSSNVPKQVPNGTVETRKRSRSGTRIRRSLDTNGTVFQRGPKDSDGTAFKKFRSRQYLERDNIHKAALLHDYDKVQEANASNRAEVEMRALCIHGMVTDISTGWQGKGASGSFTHESRRSTPQNNGTCPYQNRLRYRICSRFR